ncbi:hypothetical protein QE152_g32537 [Popillia japonica]|uniref:Uncharacterized protein n=1 Tax=Popillia japonica TaxID=7064 RepID=A0AAW1IZG5_POPJA
MRTPQKDIRTKSTDETIMETLLGKMNDLITEFKEMRTEQKTFNNEIKRLQQENSALKEKGCSVGLTETKKKGKGEILIKGGHLLLYSGVKEEKRATEGVGCFIKKEYLKYVRNWTAVSERILKVEMELEEAMKTTIITVYGPNEDVTLY